MSDVSSTRLKSRQTEDFRDAIDFKYWKRAGRSFSAISLAVVQVGSICCDNGMGGDMYKEEGRNWYPRGFALRMGGASHDFAGAPIRYIDYRSCGV